MALALIPFLFIVAANQEFDDTPEEKNSGKREQQLDDWLQYFIRNDGNNFVYSLCVCNHRGIRIYIGLIPPILVGIGTFPVPVNPTRRPTIPQAATITNSPTKP